MKFRERLIKTGKDKEIWKELQKLKAKGLKVKKGIIQDATFITSLGHAINPEVTKQKQEGVRKEHGQRRTANPTLVSSFI